LRWPGGGGRVLASGLGGDGRILKGSQGGAAVFHRLPGRRAAAGGEVVAGGDLGEPLLEPVQVRLEAVLATRESPSAPPQYVDPIALASLIVAIASLAWTVYTDLKKRTATPAAEVVARTVQVTRRNQGQADAPDHIIEVVVTEAIRAAAGQEHAEG
jgi:hypothetical protein